MLNAEKVRHWIKTLEQAKPDAQLQALTEIARARDGLGEAKGDVGSPSAVRMQGAPASEGLNTLRNALIARSSDANPAIRAEVVLALSVLGDVASLDVLREALNDVDPGVRLAAVAGLEEAGAADLESILLEVIKTEAEDSVRAEAILVLGRAQASPGMPVSLDEVTLGPVRSREAPAGSATPTEMEDALSAVAEKDRSPYVRHLARMASRARLNKSQ